MATYPGFIGPTYRTQCSFAADDRCINWFPQPIEKENPKSPWMFIPVPGLVEIASPPLNRCRGSLSMDGRVFFVIGYKFVELLENGDLLDRGDVEINENPATLTSSGDQGREVMITSGRHVYIFNLDTDAFTHVPFTYDPFGGPNGDGGYTTTPLAADFGAYLSGRFITLDAEKSILRISDVDDGLKWNPLRYRVRAKAPDKWKAMVVHNDAIWLMGSQTYEVWWNTGGTPFPFDPINGALFPVGIAAPYTLRGMGGHIYWVTATSDGQGAVMRAAQYAPEKVSNHGIDFQLQSMKGLSTCESMTYEMHGHNFWVVTSRKDDVTLAFDAATQMWHEPLEWEHGNAEAANWTAWRPIYHCFGFGKHIVGDRANGIIYELSPNVYTGPQESLIRRLRRAPHLSFENKVLRYRGLEVDLQRGVGLIEGYGSDPQVMMRYSDDGGMTFGSERMATAGKMGKYHTRVRYTRLGASRNRVFEVSVTDPVPWYIIGANITL